MSMIEKFLEKKESLRNSIEEIRDAALKAAAEKVDEMISNFVDDFKEKIAEASDAEFIEFITSGKLDDEDINAAIMFRSQAKHDSADVEKNTTCDEQAQKENEKPTDAHAKVYEIHNGVYIVI